MSECLFCFVCLTARVCVRVRVRGRVCECLSEKYIRTYLLWFMCAYVWNEQRMKMHCNVCSQLVSLGALIDWQHPFLRHNSKPVANFNLQPCPRSIGMSAVDWCGVKLSLTSLCFVLLFSRYILFTFINMKANFGIAIFNRSCSS